MKNLKELITQSAFKNDKFSHNMFRSKSNTQLRELCKQATSFLPETVSDAQRAWHCYHELFEYPLCSGGNERRSFTVFSRGYTKTCHLPRFKCSCWDDARISSSNTFTTTNSSGKIKKAIQEKYGVDHITNVPEIRQKISEKRKEQSSEWKVSFQKTMNKRYGVSTTLQSDILKQKVKDTCLERYGVENSMMVPEIREKARQTCLERYGVSNARQIHCLPVLHQINNPLVWNSFLKIQEANTLFGEYFNVNTIRKYAYRFRPDLIGLGTLISSPHQKIINLLNEHQIVHDSNTRKVINPLELDIFIPSKNLAIEVNGIYWHSEVSGKKPPKYHLTKTLECEKIGVRLLQFWDNEIHDQWDIVSSMILNQLSVTQNRIYARKCQLATVTKDQEKEFLNNNHIQGYSSSSICLGLSYQNELVSLMSFRTPRYNKKFKYELVRFVNKINTQVVGGASKLFKYRPEGSCISYADRRYSQGKVYQILGMNMTGYSLPSYHYTNDYISFVHRSNFRKKLLKSKLESFDPALTEWQNMINHGYDRVWDCGTQVYCCDF